MVYSNIVRNIVLIQLGEYIQCIIWSVWLWNGSLDSLKASCWSWKICTSGTMSIPYFVSPLQPASAATMSEDIGDSLADLLPHFFHRRNSTLASTDWRFPNCNLSKSRDAYTRSLCICPSFHRISCLCTKCRCTFSVQAGEVHMDALLSLRLLDLNFLSQ